MFLAVRLAQLGVHWLSTAVSRVRSLLPVCWTIMVFRSDRMVFTGLMHRLTIPVPHERTPEDHLETTDILCIIYFSTKRQKLSAHDNDIMTDFNSLLLSFQLVGFFTRW